MIAIAKFKILFLLIHTQKMMLTTWDFEDSYDPKRPKILVEHNVWYYKDYLKVNDKFYQNLGPIANFSVPARISKL